MPETTNTKKIGIIQIGTGAQLLASVQAIDGLRKEHPDAQISLFCAQECEELVEFIPQINEAYLIDRTQVLAGESGSLLDLEFDLLINLSLDAAAQLLASRMRAGHYIGARLEADAFGGGGDIWSCYQEAVVGKSDLNPYHLSDVLKGVAGARHADAEYTLNAEVAAGIELPYKKRPGHPAVLIPASAFEPSLLREIIENILNSSPNLEVIVTGTLRNQRLVSDLIEHLCADSSRIFNLCGRTSLREFTALAYQADIVVANATLPLFIAAGFGTFTIYVASPGQNLIERAPYGHGHLILQPINHGELRALPETIAEIITASFSAQDQFPLRCEAWMDFFDARLESLQGHLRAFITQRISVEDDMRPSRVELRLRPLLYLGAEYREAFSEIYRVIWNYELLDSQEAISSLDVLHEDTLPRLKDAIYFFHKLCELAIFGEKYSREVSILLEGKKFAEAKTISAKLQEVDDSILLLSDSASEVVPLANMYQLSQYQIDDSSPKLAAIDMAKCYNLLQKRSIQILDLIQSLFYQQLASSEIEAAEPAERGPHG